MPFKEGQFDVVELMVNGQFKTFSIKMNPQHVNRIPPLDLTAHINLITVQHL